MAYGRSNYGRWAPNTSRETQVTDQPRTWIDAQGVRQWAPGTFAVADDFGLGVTCNNPVCTEPCTTGKIMCPRHFAEWIAQNQQLGRGGGNPLEHVNPGAGPTTGPVAADGAARALTAGLDPTGRPMPGMAPYQGATPDPAVDETSRGALYDGVRRSRSNKRDGGLGDAVGRPDPAHVFPAPKPAKELGGPISVARTAELLGADRKPDVHGYRVTEVTEVIEPALATLMAPLQEKPAIHVIDVPERREPTEADLEDQRQRAERRAKDAERARRSGGTRERSESPAHTP